MEASALLGLITVQIKNTLQAIRPCRESEMGWIPEVLPGTHSSLELNERGLALKVFWSRPWRDGRRDDGRTRLPKSTRVVKQWLTKKTGPEGVGAGAILSAPFGSKIGEPSHQLNTR